MISNACQASRQNILHQEQTHDPSLSVTKAYISTHTHPTQWHLKNTKWHPQFTHKYNFVHSYSINQYVKTCKWSSVFPQLLDTFSSF